METDTGTSQSLKCQLVPGATEGERRGTSKLWTPNSVKTGGVCPQCWGTAVWSPSPSTSHEGDPTHSTWVCVTDSQCVQVTKIGHVLPQSPFHGVLDWVRLGYGQGCPSLTCVPEQQSPGHAELSEGLRGLSLGLTHGEPLDKGKSQVCPAGWQWDLPGHLRQFILLPRAGGFTSCHQGPHSLFLPVWLDSILKVLSNLIL